MLGTTKTVKLIKKGLKVCSSCIYGLNVINNMNLNSPRHW